ncbi:MAG: carbon storage regulator [Planctomycetaceae bacterium]
MSVLVLARKPGESVRISVGGEEVDIVLASIRGNRARLSVHAAQHVSILRGELIEPENDPKNRSAA